MSPVVEAITQWRSVTFCQARTVLTDMIDSIVDAGNWAPTDGNLQRWRLVVVANEELGEILLNATVPTCQKVMSRWKYSESVRLLPLDDCL